MFTLGTPDTSTPNKWDDETHTLLLTTKETQNDILQQIEVNENKQRTVKNVPCQTPFEDTTNISKSHLQGQGPRVCNVNEKEGETHHCRETDKGSALRGVGRETRKTG